MSENVNHLHWFQLTVDFSTFQRSFVFIVLPSVFISV